MNLNGGLKNRSPVTFSSLAGYYNNTRINTRKIYLAYTPIATQIFSNSPSQYKYSNWRKWHVMLSR
jgi:hypothetical protein